MRKTVAIQISNILSVENIIQSFLLQELPSISNFVSNKINLTSKSNNLHKGKEKNTPQLKTK